MEIDTSPDQPRQIPAPKLPLVNEKSEPKPIEKMERGEITQSLQDSRDEAARANKESSKSRETILKLNNQLNEISSRYEQQKRDFGVIKNERDELESSLNIANRAIENLKSNPISKDAGTTGEDKVAPSEREVAHAIISGIYASGWMPTTDTGSDPTTKKIIGIITMAQHVAGMSKVLHAELIKKGI